MCESFLPNLTEKTPSLSIVNIQINPNREIFALLWSAAKVKCTVKSSNQNQHKNQNQNQYNKTNKVKSQTIRVEISRHAYSLLSVDITFTVTISSDQICPILKLIQKFKKKNPSDVGLLFILHKRKVISNAGVEA